MEAFGKELVTNSVSVANVKPRGGRDGAAAASRRGDRRSRRRSPRKRRPRRRTEAGRESRSDGKAGSAKPDETSRLRRRTIRRPSGQAGRKQPSGPRPRTNRPTNTARNDLPPDSMLAMAGPAALALADAKPTATPAATPAATSDKKATATPAKETSGHAGSEDLGGETGEAKPRPQPETKTPAPTTDTTTPAVTAAEKPAVVDRYAGGSQTKLDIRTSR